MNRILPLARAAAVVVAGVLLSGASMADQPAAVYSFDGTHGGLPYAGLTIGSDGWFYGATYFGANAANADSWGVLYRVKQDGSGYTVLHAFTGGADGGTPFGNLVQGADGAFYGATMTGDQAGPAPFGTLYRVTAAGEFGVIHTFTGADGSFSTGALTSGADGALYGIGQSGGPAGAGVVFKLNTDGSQYQVLHAFDNGSGGGTPEGGVVFGTDGLLYGVGNDGGAAADGIVYSLAPDGSAFKVLHSFASASGEGRRPMSALVLNKDGYFYGTTNLGGTWPCACGTVFRVNPSGDFLTVHSFQGDVDGSGPSSPVTFGANGHLYGTTFNGGANIYFGTSYELDRQGRLKGVVTLTNTAFQLSSGLTTGADGQFYTTAGNGGSSMNGAIVKFDPAAYAAPVVPLPITGISVTRQHTTAGHRALLSWGATNAGHCEASGAWEGYRKTSGSLWIRTTEPGKFTYAITCFNSAGSTSAKTMLIVD